MKRFYEQDIKDLILEKQHLFVSPTDESTVVFEKAITVGSTIADCLIFSKEKGIIGVEIKTERDTTRRLNKQLKSYNLICDYTYVMCHDNHVEKVEDILSKNGCNNVGILAYTEFKGVPILGVYRPATRSPYKKVSMAYQMLWKEEINNILGSFKRQMKTLEEFGVNVNTVDSRSGGLNGLYVQSNASKKYLKKGQMIDMIIGRLGETEANKLLCNIFIAGKMHPEKHLTFHHFKKKK